MFFLPLDARRPRPALPCRLCDDSNDNTNDNSNDNNHENSNDNNNNNNNNDINNKKKKKKNRPSPGERLPRNISPPRLGGVCPRGGGREREHLHHSRRYIHMHEDGTLTTGAVDVLNAS